MTDVASAAPDHPPTEFSGGKTTTTSRKGWPRLHLIYFALALFDFIAIGGGLYLSHRLSSVFAESMAKHDEWSERFVSIWELGDLALDLNGPANDVFETKDVPVQRERLEKAADRFSTAIDAVRDELASNVPPALASHPIKTLTFVDQATRITLTHARRTLDEFEQGQFEKATVSMALMDRSFSSLKRKLNDSIIAVRQIQLAYANGYKAQVASLKRYEYLIGGGMLAMVCCVMAYGHMVGRFLTRRYADLEASHVAAIKAEGEAHENALRAESAQAAAERLNIDLARSLEQLTKAQDELLRRGKLAQLGQLTATVAHELRNPLGAVRTSLFLMERKLKGKGLGVEPQIERINNGVTRCDGIISQLLDFARSKSLNPETVVVDDWLAGVVQEEAAKLPASLAIECSLGLGTITADIDTSRMTRVVINLLSNAAEAMVGRGEDPAKSSVAVPTVSVTTRQTARGIEFSVADNGPGISEENLKRILEPLFTTKSFGTGLGLPAVEKILLDHGGGLDIASIEGQGATFTAWFPLVTQAKSAA